MVTKHAVRLVARDALTHHGNETRFPAVHRPGLRQATRREWRLVASRRAAAGYRL